MPVPRYPLEAWMDNVALAALSSKETLWATYQLAKMQVERGVPGDFVECGVYGGAQCAVMARAILDSIDLLESRPSRHADGHKWPRVHCFDTFAGIPAAGQEDAEFLAAGHQPGLSACSLESVKAHMKEWSLPEDLFVYHQGDFDATVPAFSYRARVAQYPFTPKPKTIALLRLDGDLYRSTKVCMEHLYPLVSRGGWVIIDDWNLSGARKAVEEVVKPSPIYFVKGE